MKRFFLSLIITFTFFLKSNGCDCIYSTILEYYFNSDIVLLAEIIDTYDYKCEEYKVKVKILNLFKGDSIDNFIVYSNPPSGCQEIENGDTVYYFSDCDLYLKKGEKRIIFSNRNKNGVFGFGFCSPARLYEHYDKNELDFLNSKPNIDSYVFKSIDLVCTSPEIDYNGEKKSWKSNIFKYYSQSIKGQYNYSLIIDNSGNIENLLPLDSESAEHTDTVMILFNKIGNWKPGFFNGKIPVKTEIKIVFDFNNS